MNKNHLFFVGLMLLNSCYISAAEKNPTFEATKVAGNIYILAGSEDHSALLAGDFEHSFSGGNIGLSVGSDGVLIVDAKYARFVDSVKAAIARVGGNAPKYILNTHYHDDHMNANFEFSETGTVIAHSKARTRISQEQPEESWPVITFDDQISVHFNGEEIKVIHYPSGHTDGDAVIFFTGADVVHMGDLYFNGYLPYIELKSGGSVEGYINNISNILERVTDDVKIIPGHGPVASKQDLNNYYRMLTETSGLVTEQMKAGLTLEEIKQKGLQKEWAKLAWAMVSETGFIEVIYNSFTK